MENGNKKINWLLQYKAETCLSRRCCSNNIFNLCVLSTSLGAITTFLCKFSRQLIKPLTTVLHHSQMIILNLTQIIHLYINKPNKMMFHHNILKTLQKQLSKIFI